MQQQQQQQEQQTQIQELDHIDSVPTNLTHRNVPSNKQDSKSISQSNEIKSSRRPKSTALKQQRLPAWQPVLTAQTVMPLFFVIGTIFVIIGAVLFSVSNNTKEKVVEYTECVDVQSGLRCSEVVKNTSYLKCTCSVAIEVEELYPAPVYLYYGLTNFYQNHRRYVKSRDDNQLLGNDVNANTISSECKPFDSNGSLVYAPCGVIANSLFNDSFILQLSSQTVPLIRTGIAWATDKSTKFNNPKSFENTLKPPNWRKNITELDSLNSSNYGYKNEDLIVWMRTAALPNFRKFYRKIDHSNSLFSSGLPKGIYNLTIDYNYPVTMFDGKKFFVISTTSWIGGKNPFLGIAYLVVGCLCVVLGFVFLAIHLLFGKKLDDDFNAFRTANTDTQ